MSWSLLKPHGFFPLSCCVGLLSRGDAGIFMRFPPPTYRGKGTASACSRQYRSICAGCQSHHPVHVVRLCSDQSATGSGAVLTLISVAAERIWDHCAGFCIVEEAGGKVCAACSLEPCTPCAAGACTHTAAFCSCAVHTRVMHHTCCPAMPMLGPNDCYVSSLP